MKRKVVLPTLKRSSRKRKATNVATRDGVAANMALMAVHADKAMRNAMVPRVQRHTTRGSRKLNLCVHNCVRNQVSFHRESVLI